MRERFIAKAVKNLTENYRPQTVEEQTTDVLEGKKPDGWIRKKKGEGKKKGEKSSIEVVIRKIVP
jgi:hypothetical protein